MEVFVFMGLAVALVLGLIGFFGRCPPVVAGVMPLIPGMPRISLMARPILCVSAAETDSTREKYRRTAWLFG